MSPSLCIVTPIRESVPAPAAQGLVDFVAEYSRRGGPVFYRTNWRASSLAIARNELVKAALATGADLILHADADIVFTTEDVDALLAADVGSDVVSGLFKKRNADNADQWVGLRHPDGTERGDLVEMSRVGFGLVLVRREALQSLHDAHGDGLFEFRWDGVEVVGEDYAFCDKWRAMGGRIWAHTEVRLGHVGPHIFT